MLKERDLEAAYPLAPQQQGMLFEWLRAPESGVHIEQSLLTLESAAGGKGGAGAGLDLAAFREAWRRLGERHPILRTAFVWENRREPLQVVLHRADIPVRVEDWRRRPAGEHEALLATHLAADARRGLPLNRAPLMRLALFQLAGGRTLLVWTSHHILLDGWSRSRLFGELLTLYGALVRGEEPPELPPVRPYGDYVAWLGKQDEAAAAAFWRRQLAGLAGVTTLPSAPAGEAGPEPRPEEWYGSLRRGLGGEAGHALEELARRRRVTLNTVVQAALGRLLSRYSGRGEVVFGVTVSGRPRDLPGVEAMVGPFLNTLPLRLSVPTAGPFDAWLPGVQAAALALGDHQHCSEGQIHAWSRLPPSAPLYEAALVFENFPLVEQSAAAGELGFRVRGLEQRGARTKYLLTLLVFAGAGELSFELVYDRRRLAPGGAERFAGQLVALVESVAREPATDLGKLSRAIPDSELPRRRPAAAGEVDATPPRTAVERLLAPVWARVLGVEGLGVHASFLALGGHSLLALELAEESRRALGCEVPLRLLFAAPTVAGLAAAVLAEEAARAPAAAARALGEEAAPERPGELPAALQDRLWEALAAARRGPGESAAPPAVEPRPAERHQPFPLSGIQTLYWQARGGMEPLDTHGNNLVVEFELPAAGMEQVAALEAALALLVARHDMLRAVFSPDGRQRVLPAVPRYAIRRLDLRRLAAGEAEERVASLRLRLRHRRARLDRWPPFEVAAHLLAGGRLRLQLRLEALLLDGDSRERLFQELLALVRREAPALPPLTVTFRDYAVGWRGLAARHPAFRRSRRYWLARLPALPPPVRLPTRGGGPPWPRRFVLEKETAPLLAAGAWQAVKQQAGERGLTPSAVVAGAFAAVLASAGERGGEGEGFTLPVVGNFRPPFHPDLAAVVGNFDTLYPVAVRDPGAPLAQLAGRLQEELTAALEHPWFATPELLLQLARRHRGNPREGVAATPAVVFNSLVEFNHPRHRQRLQAAKAEAPLGRQIDLSINIPQVVLNGTAAETLDGDLVVLWQWLGQALAPGVAEAVREGYRRLLGRLAGEPESWDLPAAEVLCRPAAAARREP